MKNQEAQTLCYHSTLSTALMEHHGNTTQPMKRGRYRVKPMWRIFAKIWNLIEDKSLLSRANLAVGILTWDIVV